MGNQLEGRRGGEVERKGHDMKGVWGGGEGRGKRREVERQVTTHAAATEREREREREREMTLELYHVRRDWSPEVEVRKDSCRWLQSFA
jgi:hypothetical protein